MSQAPNQFETEQFLDDAIKHGVRQKLANALDVTVSEISQQFNPYEPARKSYYYQFKRQLCALCEIDPGAARLIFADLHSSFDEWLKSVKVTGELSLLVCDVEKEAGDLIRAKLQDKPAHVQRKEALEIRAAVDRFIAELDAAGQLREAGR